MSVKLESDIFFFESNLCCSSESVDAPSDEMDGNLRGRSFAVEIQYTPSISHPQSLFSGHG